MTFIHRLRSALAPCAYLIATSLLALLPGISFAGPTDGLPKIVESIAETLRANPDLKLEFIVGLGNSGKAYRLTRHNAGFLAIDHLVSAWGAVGSTGRDPSFAVSEEAALKYDDGEVVHETLRYFTEKGAYRTDLGELFVVDRFPGRIVLIARPFYDINESGIFVGKLVAYFNQAPLHLGAGAISVISDNVDLLPGILKMKAGGSAGGHNGIRSIDENVAASLGSTDYNRMKIGIGRPGKDQGWIGDYVLETFSVAEQTELAAANEQIERALEAYIAGNTEIALRIANTKRPPRSSAVECNQDLRPK